MATEEGIVKKVEGNRAWVATTRTGACKACTARAACHSMGGGEKEMEVEVINQAGAMVGDRIVIGFRTGSLLKATFLLYVFPVLCLLFGAVAGQKLGESLSVDPALSSLFIGFLCLGISILIVKTTGNKMSEKQEYQPKIVKILQHTRSGDSSSETTPTHG
jgi:sigma-E factor negative regulatory protein RseC